MCLDLCTYIQTESDPDLTSGNGAFHLLACCCNSCWLNTKWTLQPRLWTLSHFRQLRQKLPWAHATLRHHPTTSLVFIISVEGPVVAEDTYSRFRFFFLLTFKVPGWLLNSNLSEYCFFTVQPPKSVREDVSRWKHERSAAASGAPSALWTFPPRVSSLRRFYLVSEAC